MTFCAFLVFSLFLWYPLTAVPDSWNIVNTLSGNASLFGAQAPTPTMVVMVGEYGTIRRSNDAGNTWSYPNSGVSNTLRSVVFYTPDVGVAVGENGTVLCTEDSGKSWRSVENIYQKGLYSVCFTDQNNVVAIGEAGTILISGDGGEHWQQQTPITTATLHCIAVSGAVCVVVGEQGSVVVSDDKGITWNILTSLSITTTLRSISIISESQWIVAGDKGQAYLTTDGGKTWEFRGVPQGTFQFNHIHFFDEMYGCSVGIQFPGTTDQASIAAYTNDGGVNWIPLQYTYIKEALCFYDSKTGYAAGDMGLIRKILPVKQSDNSLVYTIPEIAIGANRIYKSVSFGDEKHCVAVGYIVEGGALFKGNEALIEYSQDGGATWERSWKHGIADGGFFLDQKLRKVTAVGATTFIAVGDSGRVLRSEDGGVQWQSISVETSATLWDVAFSDSSNGLVCSSTVVYHTSDGGVHWEVVRRFSGAEILVAIPHPEHWRIYSGSSGLFQVQWTENSGAVWNDAVVPYPIDNWCWFNDTTAWTASSFRAAGNTGDQRNDLILKTSNGGKSWTVLVNQQHPPAFGLASIAFADSSRGIAVGRTDKILHTTDGGVQWQPAVSPTYLDDIVGVTYRSRTAVAVTNRGTMLRTIEQVTTGVEQIPLESRPLENILSVAPNPSNGAAIITIRGYSGGTLKVYDMLGTEVVDVSNDPALLVSAPVVNVPLHLESHPAGVYVIRYAKGAVQVSAMMVKMK